MKRALIAIIAVASLSGCAFFGAPLKALQEEKVKYSKGFEKDAAYCYEKSLEALKEWNAEVIGKKEKSYIAALRFEKIYKSCINTTEAAIFFSQTGPGKTQVEVSSLNHYLAQSVSERLFQYIENPKVAEP